MNRVPSLLVAAACGVLASVSAHAEKHDVAAKIGALGLGVEYGRAFGDRLALRVGLNGGGFGFDAEESGIAYDFDLSWDSLSAAVDFHPRAKALRVTAGLLRNGNGLDAVSRATSNVEVGSRVYTPDEVGTLRAETSFRSIAPFAGIGWDWSRSNRFFGVSFDLGVLDQGSPKVSLTADGGLVADPQFADDVAAEQAELNGSLKDFELVPYATLGFVFHF
ncbi:MAG TPA: hypothetical protein VFV10_01150 [Gammaproteobacteria bacterium]|nr:hypothetical protein [Gammaproteobacteria bacterium]